MSKPEIVFLTMKEMNLVRKSQCSRITLKKIVCWNAELNKLLKNVTIPAGGVMPHILPELLMKKGGKVTSCQS